MADLGIFGINSHNLKLELLEKPKKMKELILHEIPENIYLRIQQMKDWFDLSIKRLELNTMDIEMFV